MDESACFCKVLPAKGLAQKGKKSKGGKMSKQRITVAFFLSTDGRNVCKSIVTLWSKKARFFRLASVADKLAEVFLFWWFQILDVIRKYKKGPWYP